MGFQSKRLIQRLVSAALPAIIAIVSPRVGGVAVRKRLGNGLFFDRNQLDHTVAQTLGDLLRGLPGVALSATPTTQGVSMRRTTGSAAGQSGLVDNCRVGWFLDGRRMDRP